MLYFINTRISILPEVEELSCLLVNYIIVEVYTVSLIVPY